MNKKKDNKKDNELFASLLSRIPKEKRRDAMYRIYPHLLEISEVLHEVTGDDGGWLQQLKHDYKFLSEEQRFKRLFE